MIQNWCNSFLRWKAVVNQSHHSIQMFTDQHFAALNSSILHFTQFLCWFDAELSGLMISPHSPSFSSDECLTWNLSSIANRLWIDHCNYFMVHTKKGNSIWCHHKHSMPCHSIEPPDPVVQNFTTSQRDKCMFALCGIFIAFWYRRRANDICDDICARGTPYWSRAGPMPCNRFTIRDCCQPTSWIRMALAWV